MFFVVVLINLGKHFADHSFQTGWVNLAPGWHTIKYLFAGD